MEYLTEINLNSEVSPKIYFNPKLNTILLYPNSLLNNSSSTAIKGCKRSHHILSFFFGGEGKTSYHLVPNDIPIKATAANLTHLQLKAPNPIEESKNNDVKKSNNRINKFFIQLRTQHSHLFDLSLPKTTIQLSLLGELRPLISSVFPSSSFSNGRILDELQLLLLLPNPPNILHDIPSGLPPCLLPSLPRLGPQSPPLRHELLHLPGPWDPRRTLGSACDFHRASAQLRLGQHRRPEHGPGVQHGLLPNRPPPLPRLLPPWHALHHPPCCNSLRAPDMPICRLPRGLRDPCASCPRRDHQPMPEHVEHR